MAIRAHGTGGKKRLDRRQQKQNEGAVSLDVVKDKSKKKVLQRAIRRDKGKAKKVRQNLTLAKQTSRVTYGRKNRCRDYEQGPVRGRDAIELVDWKVAACIWDRKERKQQAL